MKSSDHHMRVTELQFYSGQARKNAIKRDEIVRAPHGKLTWRTRNEKLRDKTIWSCYMLRFLAYDDRSCTRLKDLLVRIFLLFKAGSESDTLY